MIFCHTSPNWQVVLDAVKTLGHPFPWTVITGAMKTSITAKVSKISCMEDNISSKLEVQ